MTINPLKTILPRTFERLRLIHLTESFSKKMIILNDINFQLNIIMEELNKSKGFKKLPLHEEKIYLLKEKDFIEAEIGFTLEFNEGRFGNLEIKTIN